MCSWQGQSNEHEGDLILNEAGQEMTKGRIASVHAQGKVNRKNKEQKRKMYSSGLSDPNIYFYPS